MFLKKVHYAQVLLHKVTALWYNYTSTYMIDKKDTSASWWGDRFYYPCTLLSEESTCVTREQNKAYPPICHKLDLVVATMNSNKTNKIGDIKIN